MIYYVPNQIEFNGRIDNEKNWKLVQNIEDIRNGYKGNYYFWIY